MPYNPSIEQTIVVPIKAHERLTEMAKAHKRTLKAELDLLIEQTYTQFSDNTNIPS